MWRSSGWGSWAARTRARPGSPGPGWSGWRRRRRSGPRRRPPASGADRAFPSAEALVTDPDVDVVHLCVPNDLHAPLATTAFAARQARHLREAADPRRRVRRRAARGAARRGDRRCRAVRVPLPSHGPRAAGADRGRRARARCTWCTAPISRTGSPTTSDTDWRLDPAAGGRSRAFADIGSHWFDLVEFVTGERVTRLAARFSTAFDERERTRTSRWCSSSCRAVPSDRWS